jgi:hypothetical protein
MLRIYFILIVLIIIIYFQYNYINNHNSSYEILQYENPNKNLFENILNNKLISIFTNIPINNKILLNFNNLDELSYKNLNINEKKNLNNLLVENFSYYNIPLCISSNIKLNFESPNNNNNNNNNKIIRQKYYRELIYQYRGIKKYYIFSPDQSKYLYLNKNKTYSNIDFWNQNTSKFPLINKAKYIEIIVSEGQLIYIPSNWFYTSSTEYDSISIHCISDSIFSRFLLR